MRLQPVPPGGLSWRSDVDGLRALAVAAVVLFHGFPTLVPGGYLGVDVFFVLSGYLITTILSRDIGDGRLHLGAFLARRARRILPALILVLFASWLAAWWILLPDEFATFGRHMAAGAGFVANFAYLQEVGYFDVSAES